MVSVELLLERVPNQTPREGSWILSKKEFRMSPQSKVKANLSDSKGGQMQWHTPVIPTLWEAKAGGSQGQEFKTSLANMANPVSIKNTKISLSLWYIPVIPATQKAVA